MRRWIQERAKPRDSFFFLVGTVIAYHEVFVSDEAQPLLIFTALFLWGLIPAFWGDRKPEPPKPPTPPEPPTTPPVPADQQQRSGMRLCVAC